MQRHGVPGMAVAIVEDGKVVPRQGAIGVRKLGAPERVDADTIFPTGSTGKAITTAALAILVDEGKIKLGRQGDRPPAGLPMYDPWVTREMTVRDLLTHRSGLGLGAATCCSCRAPRSAAPKPCGGCATSSPRPASAAATPTTTCCTWSPAS